MSVLLLSGGLDSAVCLALCRDEITRGLWVGYGQPHSGQEHASALKLARACGLPLQRASVGLWDVSRDDPAMYVPGRNAVLLSMANAVREQHGGDCVIFGANKDDHDNYPDCRPAFLDALPFSVKAPLVNMTKAEVGELAYRLGVPVRETWSCYWPTLQDTPCGRCDACRVRERALA